MLEDMYNTIPMQMGLLQLFKEGEVGVGRTDDEQIFVII